MIFLFFCDPRERAVLIDACAKYNVRAVFLVMTIMAAALIMVPSKKSVSIVCQQSQLDRWKLEYLGRR